MHSDTSVTRQKTAMFMPLHGVIDSSVFFLGGLWWQQGPEGLIPSVVPSSQIFILCLHIHTHAHTHAKNHIRTIHSVNS